MLLTRDLNFYSVYFQVDVLSVMEHRLLLSSGTLSELTIKASYGRVGKSVLYGPVAH
jgi:hypothetical protein